MCTQDGCCAAGLRFAAKTATVPGHGCEWWLGSTGADGYARFHAGPTRARGTVTGHRWLYEHVHGPLGAEQMVLHGCDETSCVNLAHLHAGDHEQNMIAMRRRGRQGGPWHSGHADVRGPAGRARAIRAAVRAGVDAAGLAVVLAAGEPWRDQLTLLDLPADPVAGAAPGDLVGAPGVGGAP